MFEAQLVILLLSNFTSKNIFSNCGSKNAGCSRLCAELGKALPDKGRWAGLAGLEGEWHSLDETLSLRGMVRPSLLPHTCYPSHPLQIALVIMEPSLEKVLKIAACRGMLRT